MLEGLENDVSGFVFTNQKNKPIVEASGSIYKGDNI